MAGHGRHQQHLGVVALAADPLVAVEMEQVGERLAVDDLLLDRHLEAVDPGLADAPGRLAVALGDPVQHLAGGGHHPPGLGVGHGVERVGQSPTHQLALEADRCEGRVGHLVGVVVHSTNPAPERALHRLRGGVRQSEAKHMPAVPAAG